MTVRRHSNSSCSSNASVHRSSTDLADLLPEDDELEQEPEPEQKPKPEQKPERRITNNKPAAKAHAGKTARTSTVASSIKSGAAKAKATTSTSTSTGSTVAVAASTSSTTRNANKKTFEFVRPEKKKMETRPGRRVTKASATGANRTTTTTTSSSSTTNNKTTATNASSSVYARNVKRVGRAGYLLKTEGENLHAPVNNYIVTTTEGISQIRINIKIKFAYFKITREVKFYYKEFFIII